MAEAKDGARKPTRADRARSWWADLTEDRAAAARLRRAPTLDAAMLEPATAGLHRRLGGARPGESGPESYVRTALVAAVLAAVREDAPKQGFAQALGLCREGSDQPLFSPVRAIRLRRSRTPDEALDPFRRAVAILGDRADVRDLARCLLDWCDDRDFGGLRTPAERVRIDFAFAYHGAAFAAPADTDSGETVP